MCRARGWWLESWLQPALFCLRRKFRGSQRRLGRALDSCGRVLRALAQLARRTRRTRAEREEREDRQAQLEAVPRVPTMPIWGLRRQRASLDFLRAFQPQTRPRTGPELNAIDDIPAFRRARMPVEPDAPPVAGAVRSSSIWERSPAEATPVQRSAPPVHAPTPIQPHTQQVLQRLGLKRTTRRNRQARPRRCPPTPAARPVETSRTPDSIAIHGRADAEIRTATVAPKSSPVSSCLPALSSTPATHHSP